eukprot:TRINITY_DN1910_c0_g1_i2.p1 TRINITY_DN1910_c0_g1~~TRINITY_DN1910_c0_g1_i2.p1  ORF type:complete len:707 (+),score=167.15 TRINITY_DN1910_c0_g1_i2:192-2312(+)
MNNCSASTGETPRIELPIGNISNSSYSSVGAAESDESSMSHSSDFKESESLPATPKNKKMASPSPSPPPPHVNKRVEALKEILTTEKQYVNDLKILVDKFKKLFEQLQVTVTSITAVEVNLIFLNIDAIKQLHEKLFDSLESIMPNSDSIHENTSIGTVFRDFATWLKIYTLYIQGYEKAIETVSLLKKENPKFQSALEKIEKEDCHGLSLGDFLIKPVQRICKYPLLFRELLDATPESHSDHELVKQTFEKVTAVTETENKLAAEEHNFKKLFEFNERVKGYQANPSSDWLFHDEILLDKTTNKKYHVYLMAHGIILTRPKKSSKIERFELEFHLNSVEMKFSSSSKELEFEIVVKGGAQQQQQSLSVSTDEIPSPIVFLCHSNASKLAWRTAYDKAITDTKHRKRPQNRLHEMSLTENKKEKRSTTDRGTRSKSKGTLSAVSTSSVSSSSPSLTGSSPNSTSPRSSNGETKKPRSNTLTGASNKGTSPNRPKFTVHLPHGGSTCVFMESTQSLNHLFQKICNNRNLNPEDFVLVDISGSMVALDMPLNVIQNAEVFFKSKEDNKIDQLKTKTINQINELKSLLSKVKSGISSSNLSKDIDKKTITLNLQSILNELSTSLNTLNIAIKTPREEKKKGTNVVVGGGGSSSSGSGFSSEVVSFMDFLDQIEKQLESMKDPTCMVKVKAFINTAISNTNEQILSHYLS